MSDTYGVIPTGFRRKPLDTIEASLKSAAIVIFGSSVILDDESPMGQLIGLMALVASQHWELSEDTYQSLDPDQGEGVRLDQLGRIRSVDRSTAETDAAFRRRITNAGRSNIHLMPLRNAVADLDGVEFVKVWANDGDAIDNDGIEGHSLAVVVIGGDEDEVAAAIFSETVGGIGLHGNTTVEINDGGYCRPVRFLRPTIVPIFVEIDVQERPASAGCAIPQYADIWNAIQNNLGFAADYGLTNGEDLLDVRVVGVVAPLQGIDIVAVRMTTDLEGDPDQSSIEIAFDEIARVDKLVVNYL